MDNQYYCIIPNTDLKLYSKISWDRYIELDKKIKETSKILEDRKFDLFTPLSPSVATVSGKLSNISFDEEELVDFLNMPDNNAICSIKSNFGKLFHPNPVFIEKKKSKKSRQGRPAKKKRTSSRKKNGTGEVFSSQISFEIFVDGEKEKPYLIKLFRNGKLSIPGGFISKFEFLLKAIQILVDYLQKEFHDPDIKLMYLGTDMRNSKCSLINKNLRLKLVNLNEVLYMEKDRVDLKKKNELESALLSLFDESTVKPILKMAFRFNPMDITEIIYEPENSSGGIKVKFRRPTEEKHAKDITAELQGSGKININGANIGLEADEIYNWLRLFYHKNYDYIIHDLDKEYDYEYSDCSDVSIYDE